MSTNVLNKEERAALASRIGLVKKRKAETHVEAIPAPAKASTKAPLPSILTNGSDARLPTPPASSSSTSPPGSKRKRNEESELASSLSKKTKHAHGHSNINESNTNKRKHPHDAAETDTTTPRKKPNASIPSSFPLHHRPNDHQSTPSAYPSHSLLPQKPALPIPGKATTSAPTNAQPRKPRYTPTNPPPNTKFAGARWNTTSKAWEAKFTTLPSPPPPTDAPITFRNLLLLYPGGMNIKARRDATNYRTVRLPLDPSMENRWKERLADLKEMEARERGQAKALDRSWEWEMDGAEDEDVIEGKEDGGDRESPETRLDAEKAEKLRARAARRGRKSY